MYINIGMLVRKIFCTWHYSDTTVITPNVFILFYQKSATIGNDKRAIFIVSNKKKNLSLLYCRFFGIEDFVTYTVFVLNI